MNCLSLHACLQRVDVYGALLIRACDHGICIQYLWEENMSTGYRCTRVERAVDVTTPTHIAVVESLWRFVHLLRTLYITVHNLRVNPTQPLRPVWCMIAPVIVS